MHRRRPHANFVIGTGFKDAGLQLLGVAELYVGGDEQQPLVVAVDGLLDSLVPEPWVVGVGDGDVGAAGWTRGVGINQQRWKRLLKGAL